LILHLLLGRTDWKKRTGATKASEWAGPSSFHRGGDFSLAGFAKVKRMRSVIMRAAEDSDRKPDAPRGCNGCCGVEWKRYSGAWVEGQNTGGVVIAGRVGHLNSGRPHHQPALARYAIHDLARIQLRIAFAVSQQLS